MVLGEGKELSGRLRRNVKETKDNDKITLEKRLILINTHKLRIKLSP